MSVMDQARCLRCDLPMVSKRGHIAVAFCNTYGLNKTKPHEWYVPAHAVMKTLDAVDEMCDDLTEDPGYGVGWADAMLALRRLIGGGV